MCLLEIVFLDKLFTKYSQFHKDIYSNLQEAGHIFKGSFNDVVVINRSSSKHVD